MDVPKIAEMMIIPNAVNCRQYKVSAYGPFRRIRLAPNGPKSSAEIEKNVIANQIRKYTYVDTSRSRYLISNRNSRTNMTQFLAFRLKVRKYTSSRSGSIGT